MKKRQPKTEGYVWVEYSLIAFNGSGYADRTSAESFLESYIDYNKWKNRPNAVELAHQFYVPLLALAEQLLPSHVLKQPSKKNYARVTASKTRAKLL